MATINIDSELRDSNNRGKLWWHGTSTWHLRTIKDEGLKEEVECQAWEGCDKGIYFDRHAGMAAWMWARNAVEAAAGFRISGKGYPDGKFSDWWAGDLEDRMRVMGVTEENAEEILGVAWKDLKPMEEYQADEELWLENRQDIDRILLVMDEDLIPEDCTQKYNGHWKAFTNVNQGGRREYGKNLDGTNNIDHPYGVDKIPDLTDEQQRAIIAHIEEEIILNHCVVPASRFYACNVDEVEVLNSPMMPPKEVANEMALEA